MRTFFALLLYPVIVWAQKTPDDLESEIILTEEQVQQPVFLKFDTRSRLWVAEYRSHPEPAGATMKSRDRYWRTVYDTALSLRGIPNIIPAKIKSPFMKMPMVTGITISTRHSSINSSS